MNKTYVGTPGECHSIIVEIDGQPSYRLRPTTSLKLRNHSPDGFNWGYGGSGPAQLALAILLDHFSDAQNPRDAALWLYQRFKWAVIARLPLGQPFRITTAEIVVAIEALKAEVDGAVV